MKNLFLLILSILLFNSCVEYEQVKFLGVTNVSNFQKEGNKVNVEVALRVNNPNKYTIKVKPSTMEVLLNGNKIGTAFLNDKVKLKKKSENIYTADLSVELEKLNLFSLGTTLLQGKVNLQFKGNLKAGVGLVQKRFPVNESKEIPIENLKNLLNVLITQ